MSLMSVLLGHGTFAVEVAGVASCQPEVEAIGGGELPAGKERIVLAVLVPEADNPYNAEAVRVQIQRLTVGYLAPADARTLRAALAREVLNVSRYRCRAKIEYVRDHRKGRTRQWRVWLDLCLQHVLAIVLTSPFFLVMSAG